MSDDGKSWMQREMEAHPDYQRQVDEFVGLMNHRPCAVCEADDHTGFEGHKAEGSDERRD